MIKTAFDIVNESFEKQAKEFTKEEKKKIKALKKDMQLASRSAVKPTDALMNMVRLTGGSLAGHGIGALANKATGGKLPSAPGVLSFVGGAGALMPAALKQGKKSEMAIDNVLESQGYDLSKLKNNRDTLAKKLLKGTYTSATFKGVAKDAIRSQREEKTAFDIVNESFEKQAGMVGMAKGLMTATKMLGKNSKGLLKGVGGMLSKNKGFMDIAQNKGIQNAAKNIGKGMILPTAGVAGANYALNTLSPKNQTNTVNTNGYQM